MSAPESGRMSWAQALSGPLADATCLWQDLDGLHVEPAPVSPPPTSLLWAWHGSTHLARIRLDGDTAFVAVHTVANDGEEPVAVAPWAPGDERIAAYRGPAAAAGGLGAAYEQIVVDGTADGGGPITFIRPSRSAKPPGPARSAGGHAQP